MKLHDYELSAECYAVRLFLGILGLRPEIARIDVYPGREHEAPAFRELSPLARVPVLEDGDLVLWDWQAILVHLATAHDPARAWYPRAEAGQVAQWLGVADELATSAGLARLHDSMFVAADIAACRRRAHALLRILDEHLWYGERAERPWAAGGERPTIADLALFPHVMLSEEGGIGRQDYPALRRWGDRVKRLPGFSPMSGIFPAAPAPGA